MAAPRKDDINVPDVLLPWLLMASKGPVTPSNIQSGLGSIDIPDVLMPFIMFGAKAPSSVVPTK